MKCPGQDMQYWNSQAIYEVDCPKCGKSVEFYKDDTNRKCHHCGNRFVNPKMDFGCAAYCQYAEQCLGTLPEEFVGNQDNLLKDKIAVEIKRYLQSDFQRIGHIARVARYAESIGKDESANVPIILCAAYLHDLGGINSSETSRVKAKDILLKLQAKEAMTSAVLALLDSQNQQSPDKSIELKILEDAIYLAILEEQLKKKDTGADVSIDRVSSQLQTSTSVKSAKFIIDKYTA